ncbi:MAG: phage tail family protein [Fervidobacterium sp.]|uniref:phage tail domain-containing protein n=1 Tax=Fervidobacterium sp. TaxID=1871331 RepID=UPI0025BDE7F0|nr:phage tail domain-containing protein [Fervidobacterium sp.]NPU89978.1 phage tail family protein [Fervidobacterium sp.]
MRCDNLSVLSNGKTWSLSEISGRDIWVSEANFGNPGIERITDKGPFTHGIKNIDFRVNPRVIQLSIVSIARTTEQHYINRQRLLEIFKPSNNDLVLIYKYPNGKERRINCLYNGGLDFPFDRMSDGRTMTWAIELLCPDPMWYVYPTHKLSFQTSGSSHLVFPFAFGVNDDLQFGIAYLSDSATIDYLGDDKHGGWMSFPSITLTGPLNGFTITNVTTDEKITFNRRVDIGEVVTINLTYNEKSIRSNLNPTEELSGCVTPDSDLATFHIGCSPEVSDNINIITLSATEMTAGTSKIEIEWYDRYIGI